MAYGGNRYAMNEVGGRLLWSGTTQGLSGWTVWQNNSWDFNESEPATLIPGDIIVMEHHVAIIFTITYTGK